MPRKGITQKQVAEARRALLDEGRDPSVRAIQKRLGTGSNQTIMRHLAAIRVAATPVAEADTDLLEKFLERHQELLQRHLQDLQDRAHHRNTELRTQLHEHALKSRQIWEGLETVAAHGKQHAETLHQIGDAGGASERTPPGNAAD